MVELTVSIKGEDSTYKQKFLVYDEFHLHNDDPLIKEYIRTAKTNSNIIPETIKIKALLIVQ